MRRLIAIGLGLLLSGMLFVGIASADGADYQDDYTGLGDPYYGYTPVPGEPFNYYVGKPFDESTEVEKPYANWAVDSNGAMYKFPEPQWTVAK